MLTPNRSLLAAILVVGTLHAQESPRNVLLIGWDGTQRAHLQEMLARQELPNLTALSSKGALVDIDVITGATDTKAGWTQILTGYTPARTGVFSNAKFRPIPVGYTIFERVEALLGDDAVETRAIIGKKGHIDAAGPSRILYDRWLKRQARQQKKNPRRARRTRKLPVGASIVEEGGVKYALMPGKPYFHTKQHIDLFVNGLVTNEKVGAMALANLEECKDRRFLFFVHFAEPDHTGHKHGENSQEYTDAIKSDDAWTGKLLARLEELGLGEKTLVYVVVDHGFDEGLKSHKNAPHVFLATNDPAVRRGGKREDIAPTVLKRFGVDLAQIQPPLDGTPLDVPLAKKQKDL